ncbi:MAG: NAD(P)/FAD-dependent oxidoreductase, partial [Caulobacterales bacterium]|nr:NAD(P)/FAD-dependent oxidoreductase [Caulobacterales bacterium]
MAEQVDCVVVGAGVVGLAVARALALDGREVLVLERADVIGSETSSRNSEVIHAGIYYPTGSLKARSCVAGKERLYAFCVERGVAHRRCGKLIVASREEELARLEALQRKGADNGVHDLTLLDGDAARAMEPALSCVGALHSPSTGIVDSHAFMLALLGEAEAAGAVLVLRAPVEAGAMAPDHVRLWAGGGEQCALEARLVVNSAGLHAQAIAGAITGLPPGAVPARHIAKGCYFTLSGRAPFSRLIYPAPEPGGLGVHLTIDLGGQARFGPDVEWVDTLDYDVDPARGERFYDAVRRYWPGLPDGALQPGYSGIRPKVAGPGEPAGDFIIQGPSDHGAGPLINLYGIESPGLTASLALADR